VIRVFFLVGSGLNDWSLWLSVTSEELSIILVRVLNCYSVVSVESRIAGVLLRVEGLLLPEFLLGLSAWRL
jgi:hypothetical protein